MSFNWFMYDFFIKIFSGDDMVVRTHLFLQFRDALFVCIIYIPGITWPYRLFSIRDSGNFMIHSVSIWPFSFCLTKFLFLFSGTLLNIECKDQVSNVKYRISTTRHQIQYDNYRRSTIEYPVSNINIACILNFIKDNTGHRYKSQVLEPGRISDQQLEAFGQSALSTSGESVREVTEFAGALAGDGRFMSDVYSFGIVVWEVLSTQV